MTTSGTVESPLFDTLGLLFVQRVVVATIVVMVASASQGCTGKARDVRGPDSSEQSVTAERKEVPAQTMLRRYAGRDLPTVIEWRRRGDGTWDRRCLLEGVLLLRDNGQATEIYVLRSDSSTRLRTSTRTCPGHPAGGDTASSRATWRSVGDAIELRRAGSTPAGLGAIRRGRWIGDTLAIETMGQGTNGEPILLTYVRAAR